MDREKHFLPKSKLHEFISYYTKERAEKEVIGNLQNFSEKFLSDIINRSMILAKHRGNNSIQAEDILFLAEKEFDYSFGKRTINGLKNLPTDEHKERLADLSKNK